MSSSFHPALRMWQVSGVVFIIRYRFLLRNEEVLVMMWNRLFHLSGVADCYAPRLRASHAQSRQSVLLR